MDRRRRGLVVGFDSLSLGVHHTLSYCGIAGACVAFFRQDLSDLGTGSFVAGRFLTDQS